MKTKARNLSHNGAPGRRTAKTPKRKAGKPARTAAFAIVGVGASAGGYEAFTKFLQKLPPKSGMAYVFIQHLDPKHESKLTELLRRSTNLPVFQVNRAVKVEPNAVYVIPPNRNLTIHKGRLEPKVRRKAEMPPMPVDLFLRSLAEDQGQNGIGVILSGNGSDGTLGLEAIKGADGITFAQSPQTAKYTGMPSSAIASGCVDFVLSPERMAHELAKLQRHPELAAARGKGAEPRVEAEHPLPKIHTLLRSHTGVVFSAYKQSTLTRRILRRMVVHQISRMEEYVTYLRQHPAEVEALAEDVLITVTRFFRDSKSLEVLRRKVFPALMKGRNPGLPIRVWVPGCSSGEEVYSLAILLAEFLGKDAARYPVQIFGTDISETAIAKARAGIYRGNIAMDVSPERLRRFFTPWDDSFRIARAIRDQCVFARQDLGSDPPFSQLDLISCQNVLIYFGPDLQHHVLPVFYYALKPRGFLVLGSAESVGALGDLFTLVDTKQRIYSKNPGVRPLEAPFATKPQAAEASGLVRLEPIPREPVLPTLDKVADRVLLQHCAPSGVVVDAEFQVLQFRGVTSPYLEHKTGAANLNLLKLAREELVMPLHTAMARAMKQRAAVRREVIWTDSREQSRHLNLAVIPFKAPPLPDSLLLVTFEEGARAGVLEKPGRRLQRHDGKSAVDKETQRLQEELENTRESLQAIIEEQEATNEELKSANEESQSSNEELQSTNEELETAKEEMQSSNEELATVNDELRHTNLEASRLNNDLVNLLASVQIPVVMVDNDLMVRRFTPSAQKFFNLIPSDIGRSLGDIKVNFDLENLDEMIRDVIETLHLRETQVQDRNGRWYSLRVRPYRTKDNKIDGAVLALVDIDEFKRAVEDMGDMLWDPFLTLSRDLRVVKANQAFYDKFQTLPKETVGDYIYELGDRQWNIPRLRTLLEDVLPKKTRIKDFSVTHNFPRIGQRKMLLNGRVLDGGANGEELIILAIRDITSGSGTN